jgi:hypothetical protein
MMYLTSTKIGKNSKSGSVFFVNFRKFFIYQLSYNIFFLMHIVESVESLLAS